MQATKKIMAYVRIDSELADFLFEILKAEYLAGNIKTNRSKAFGRAILFNFELKEPIWRVGV